jgi:hypothetical protein
MRCPDCNKFVSFEEEDPEVEDLEVGDDGVVSMSARISNNCADCGTELKTGTVEGEASLHDEIAAHECKKKDDYEDDPERKGFDLSVCEEDAMRDQRVEGKGRGARTFYQAVVNVTVTCERCDETFEGEVVGEIQASAMDECV